MMTFGLFLSFMQIYEEQRGVDMYKNMLELAVLADELGFDNIWVPEHHLIHYIPAPNALLVANQVGQYVTRTPRSGPPWCCCHSTIHWPSPATSPRPTTC